MVSGSTNLVEFLDLGDQPNGNHFVDEENKDKEPKFPLKMLVCPESWLVQIGEYPSPEFVFCNHPYISGVNVPIVKHFKRMAKHMVEKFSLEKNSLVIDIGANDGTFLRAFQDNGMRTLGVDPGQKTGQLCRSQGTTVCETFWNEETGKALRHLNLNPSLITATAVFYHIPDLHSFVKGLTEVMSDTTIFATQCVYLKDLMEGMQYDHFYHEHTCLYSLKPLVKLFEMHGLRVLDVEFYDVHGGSFVAYVGRKDCKFQTNHSVEDALAKEEEAGLYDMKTYEDFRKRCEKNKEDLNRLLKELKEQGKSVYALGAPLKGSTLLNYCGIGPDLVQCATEVNQFKIGKLVPGVHIPVVDETKLDKQPDYYLVLSWNFLDFFVDKYSDYLKAGGKFIVPNPDVRIVGSEALS